MESSEHNGAEYPLEDNRSDGACSALKGYKVADGKYSGRDGKRSDIIKNAIKRAESVWKCVDDNPRRTPSSSVNEVSKGVCNGCANDQLQAEGSVTVGIAYAHNPARRWNCKKQVNWLGPNQVTATGPSRPMKLLGLAVKERKQGWIMTIGGKKV
ncbi:hypothetical protein Ancab_001774 [Ancistrocladus abbreviatus]